MSDETGSTAPGNGPVIDQDGQLDAGNLGLVAWITDVGHARKRNEDRLLVKRAFDGRFLLLVVADGAGGHNAGDKAATTVVETLNEVFSDTGDPPEGPPAGWLTDVILASHAKVRALASGEKRPPASTLVGLLVEEETLCGWRFHVGDSRLYGRHRGGQLLPWTRDHNITNGLIDRGLPVAQALKIAEGPKLTQVMGGGASPEPEIRGPFQLAGQDSFLICSDGIYGYNEDRDPLSPAVDPMTGDAGVRAQALKAAVLDGEAMDNLTAVVWNVPTEITPSRQRLGLVKPYDRQDVTTMVNLTAHRPGGDELGPTGPPPPSSMPSLRSVGDQDLPQSGENPGPDLREAQARLDEAAERRRSGLSPGFKFGMLLMATVGLLLWFNYSRDPGDINEPMSPEQMTAERNQARALAGLPPEEPSAAQETDLPIPVAGGSVESSLVQLIAGFEPGWWSGLSVERRTELQSVLRDLLGPLSAEPMTLKWVVGDPPTENETTIADWFAPGGANADLAKTAWSARGRVLGLHSDLADQPGMDRVMRNAACHQVTLRWPWSEGTSADASIELPAWLTACLPPNVDGASLSVRLGAYPGAGWTDEDWTEMATLANSPGGAGSVTRFDPSSWNPRLVELGQLTLALSQQQLQDVEVELHVALDGSDDLSLATKRSQQAARLLREGSGGVLQVQALGSNSNPLAEESEALLPAQARKLADLNRRLEVTLFRSSALELDEEEAEESTAK